MTNLPSKLDFFWQYHFSLTTSTMGFFFSPLKKKKSDPFYYFLLSAQVAAKSQRFGLVKCDGHFLAVAIKLLCGWWSPAFTICVVGLVLDATSMVINAACSFVCVYVLVCWKATGGKQKSFARLSSSWDSGRYFGVVRGFVSWMVCAFFHHSYLSQLSSQLAILRSFYSMENWKKMNCIFGFPLPMLV